MNGDQCFALRTSLVLPPTGSEIILAYSRWHSAVLPAVGKVVWNFYGDLFQITSGPGACVLQGRDSYFSQMTTSPQQCVRGCILTCCHPESPVGFLGQDELIPALDPLTMYFSAQFFLLLKTRPGLDTVSLGTFPDGPPGWSPPEDHGSPPGIPGCLVWLPAAWPP